MLAYVYISKTLSSLATSHFLCTLAFVIFGKYTNLLESCLISTLLATLWHFNYVDINMFAKILISTIVFSVNLATNFYLHIYIKGTTIQAYQASERYLMSQLETCKFKAQYLSEALKDAQDTQIILKTEIERLKKKASKNKT